MARQKPGLGLKTDGFDLDKTAAPEVFADGISQVLMGYPVSRVVFHTILEPAGSDSRELRRASMILTMPTVALIETARNLLNLAKEAEGQLVQFSSEQAVAIQQLLGDAVSEAQEGT